MIVRNTNNRKVEIISSWPYTCRKGVTLHMTLKVKTGHIREKYLIKLNNP